MDIAVPMPCALTIIASALAPAGHDPTCDNSTARAALAVLYDNRRLLHAVAVRATHLLRDD